MNNLWNVPTSFVITLSPEMAVAVIRSIFQAECQYAKLGPSALTISDNLMTPDGGIDAQVQTPIDQVTPVNCLFSGGITGFQIKSGTSFKPWLKAALKSELLNKGILSSEVSRLIEQDGHYTLMCTGHDLTPKQRNDAKAFIAAIITEQGYNDYIGVIDVLGSSQIAEYASRYPGSASLMISNPVEEAWTLDEWQRDSHMSNVFQASDDQAKIISKLKELMLGETKHVRILGEAGLGKTRLVLEALKDESLTPCVLYIQHGSNFGQTALFRKLLKSDYEKPLILVLDELSETELTEIWRHLKPRCRYLKIISIDHGLDQSSDNEIERIRISRAPDETIKFIISNRIGNSHSLDRWVSICEGSPRVAQAVADNLYANPEDVLKPPATIDLWSRFIHGYDNRSAPNARQIDCVVKHLALFGRFGYEEPVDQEARFIGELIQIADPSIGSARFQEIITDLRARRVLQGSKTLFFVPKALHIHLWKKFWTTYGRGLEIHELLNDMPESLHTWFMGMFKYAEGDTGETVVKKLLRLTDPYFSNEILMTEKGSMFLSILTEANPGDALRLLEHTFGLWADEVLLDFDEGRQNIVWALEKIAVWQKYTVRAMQLLIRLATNENAGYSNNATGTLLGLFSIGLRSAATESSPENRLPVFLKLLRSEKDSERLLGLEAAKSALNVHNAGFRIIGPEFQGLKEEANLWRPETYDDWWQAYLGYFQALIGETQAWPLHLKSELCDALLHIAEQQLWVESCEDMAVEVIESLTKDGAISPRKLNDFFWRWHEYSDDGKRPELKRWLKKLELQYTKRDLISRFHRYVLDVDHAEINENFRHRRGKPETRALVLIKALANRITKEPALFDEIYHLIPLSREAYGLSSFAKEVACNDPDHYFLSKFIKLATETRHQNCLYAYLSVLKKDDAPLRLSLINEFLDNKDSAWLGTDLALVSEYNDDLFSKCLSALQKGWVNPDIFLALLHNKLIQEVPANRLLELFDCIRSRKSESSPYVLTQLIEYTEFNDQSAFSPDFILEVLEQSLPSDKHQNIMRTYRWEKVAQKLIQWDQSQAIPLLDAILRNVKNNYQLSYDKYVQSISKSIIVLNPSGSWDVISTHLEAELPKIWSSLVRWLEGGLKGFNEHDVSSLIEHLPLKEILSWISMDPDQRAEIIARATPKTLEDEHGGDLTRELLSIYGSHDGVQGGIFARFDSGGHSGPASEHYKRERDKYRRWLALGFEFAVIQWIEKQIEYLDNQIEREEIKEERERFV